MQERPMDISREARIVAGVSLLAVPTVMYGGVTLLGVLTHGAAGLSPGNLRLTDTQWALFRAGHAHAGVWLALSLVIQLLLDGAVLSAGMKWLARIAAPCAAVAISAGFFGLAYSARFEPLLLLGAICLLTTVILTGVGLLRRAPPSGV
jgi:hypothetical protein